MSNEQKNKLKIFSTRRLFESGKTIRLRWDFCQSRIPLDLEKVSDSGWSRSQNPVQA